MQAPRERTDVRVLVRGIGDVGSAVALRLFAGRFQVIVHDDPLPTYPRRGMCFADAMFDAHGAVLEGVRARRSEVWTTLLEWVGTRDVIPATTLDVGDICARWRANVLVDARMRKHRTPERQLDLAPLTIGLGPNFVAGITTSIVIETAWGEALGAVITAGQAKPQEGDPRTIAGYGIERVVYAPVAGTFETRHAIGDPVRAGQIVGVVGTSPIAAPLDGRLRGITRSGVPVTRNTKIVEIDPRDRQAVITGAGERPAKIADAVLCAISDWVYRTSPTRER